MAALRRGARGAPAHEVAPGRGPPRRGRDDPWRASSRPCADSRRRSRRSAARSRRGASTTPTSSRGPTAWARSARPSGSPRRSCASVALPAAPRPPGAAARAGARSSPATRRTPSTPTTSSSSEASTTPPRSAGAPPRRRTSASTICGSASLVLARASHVPAARGARQGVPRAPRRRDERGGGRTRSSRPSKKPGDPHALRAAVVGAHDALLPTIRSQRRRRSASPRCPTPSSSSSSWRVGSSRRRPRRSRGSQAGAWLSRGRSGTRTRAPRARRSWRGRSERSRRVPDAGGRPRSRRPRPRRPPKRR